MSYPGPGRQNSFGAQPGDLSSPYNPPADRYTPGGGYDPAAGYPGGQEAVSVYGSAPASYGGGPSGYTAPVSYGYGAPVGYVQAPPTNTLALISLIMSIAGFMSGGLFSIAGIIMGHLGKSQIKRTGENGNGLATWGLILGYGSLVVWALFWIGYILFILGFVALGIFTGTAGY
jgi:hypothetical protein